MADDATKILEGVFAISKPPGYSSAQVLRDLQGHFKDSKTFSGLLHADRRRRAEEASHQPKRRKHNDTTPFKLGHGGTLDPLATGVMVCGIGRGTKYLNDFLLSTKTYETVVLFGKSTETYDVDGKVVAKGPTKHITRQLVEGQLSKFRGNIKQVAPIYSALKINGMKAYEYAKLGKELPRQLEARDMNVEECELLEWYDEGSHDFRWPAEEASEEDKDAATQLGTALPTDDSASHAPSKVPEAVQSDRPQDSAGRDAAPPPFDDSLPHHIPQQEPRTEKPDSNTQPTRNTSPPPLERKPSKDFLLRLKGSSHIHQIRTPEANPATAPAARIRLTVSSGFYVRSFAHDLGIECGSYGIMAELIRTRQSKYTCVEPCPEGLIRALTYEDMEAGEATWAPKLEPVLEKWMKDHPPTIKDDGRRHDRGGQSRKTESFHSRGRSGDKRTWSDRADNKRQRRNSSSDEA